MLNFLYDSATGFLIVFLVIVMLFLFLFIFNIVTGGVARKKTPPAEEDKNTLTEPAAAEEEDEIPGAVVAVIAAAVYALSAETGKNLVVKRLKRSRTAWEMAAKNNSSAVERLG